MKKLLLFTFTFFLFTFAFAQQYGWVDISANMPELGGFTDVHIIGDEGWITGGNDKVFYTPDGGNTFQTQSLPVNSGITSSVFMINNQKGYIVSFSGDFIKTENGGTTWTTLYEPGGALNSVHFPPNSDTGYACGTNGTVYMFDDTNITDISPPANASDLQSICFPVNNADGKICGQTTIARYMDNTWNNLQFYDITYFYNSIFFVNEITGWCVGIDGMIALTSDGISWVAQASNTNKTFNDVYFINSNEGWAVGSETLMHTIDGGVTWTQEIASQTAGMELRAIYFTSAHNGYVVGNDIVLKYDEILGIGDYTSPLDFEIYPNPTKNKLQIKCSEFKTESGIIEILSLDGKKIIEKEIETGTENIELVLNNLKSGMYFCKISTDKKSSTKKLIIE